MIKVFRKILYTNKLKQANKEINIAVLLMYLFIPLLSEFWHLFAGSEKEVDWFMWYNYKYDIKWATHDVAYQSILIIFATIALIWGWEKRPRRIIGTAMLVFAILDTAFFFINFKQWNLYWLVHLATYTVELIGWHLYFKSKDK